MKNVSLFEVNWFAWGEWSVELASYMTDDGWGALFFLSNEKGLWRWDFLYIGALVRWWHWRR